jgi:hypothetical protein
MTFLPLLAAAGDKVTMRPDPNALPGSQQLASLVNGFGFWALLACLAAILFGAAMWAIGSRSSNYGAVANGKNMVFGAAIGAALVGGSAAIVNFFTAVGRGVG